MGAVSSTDADSDTPVTRITAENSNYIPEVPITEPFDQTFKAYSSSSHTNYLKDHWTSASCEGCSIIQRVIKFSISNTSTFKWDAIKPILDFTDGERTYLLHIPKKLSSIFHRQNILHGSPYFSLVANQKSTINENLDPIEPVPVVILIHGTDELMFDCEFVSQVNGNEKSWLKLSDSEGFIVVIPQARGMWAIPTHGHNSWRPYGDRLRTLWTAEFVDNNHADHFFLNLVLEDVFSLCPYVDKSKIFLAGFSNGGFMATDVALAIINNTKRTESSNSPKFPNFPIAGICAYMGGMEDDQMKVSAGISSENAPRLDQTKASCAWIESRDITESTLLSSASPNQQSYVSHGYNKNLSETRDKPDVLCITGELDCQLFSVHNAWMVLSSLECYSELDVIKGAEHEYQALSTERIWRWFMGCPHLPKTKARDSALFA